jgi:hypothetical protein
VYFRPANGSHGFYEELFAYSTNSTNSTNSTDGTNASSNTAHTPTHRSGSSGIVESDFDTLDVVEVAAMYPAEASRLYSRLVGLITARWHGA